MRKTNLSLWSFCIFWGTPLIVGLSPGYLLAAGAETQKNQESTELETMIVTAEKREVDVQDIQGSVSVISASQVEDFDLANTRDIVSMIPNLYITQSGNPMFATYASMRGITSSMTGTSVLGFYVDGVYYAPGLDISLFDVERVEVLRGPQGTLYGRDSEAGVVNVVTKRPSNHWQGSVGIDYSSFNTFEGKAMISGPILEDRLGFRAALRYYESDGYIENRYDDSEDAEQSENLDGRFTFVYTPSDRLDFQLVYDAQHYDNSSYAPFAAWDSDELRKNVDMDYPGESEKDADGLSLRSEVKWSDISLVSITTARTEDLYSANDIDLTSLDLNTMAIYSDTDTLSQEFRLFSTDEKAFQWLGGCFFLKEEKDGGYDMWMNFMNMGMGMPGETLTMKNQTDTTGFALFGEASYRFFDRLKLTMGLRYDVEQKDFDYNQDPGGPVLAMMGYSSESGTENDTFDAWLPKVAVSYDVNERLMPYASISRGFKSGGFNSTDNLGSSYDPEFTWNYEIGVKSDWFANRFRMNLAFFHIDWTDMQVEIPTDGGSTVYVDNAGEATSQGVELEIAAKPMAGLELFGGAAYTDAQYDDYTNGDEVYDDNTIMDSPEYTLLLGASYRFDNGFFISGKYRQFGKIYFDSANSQSQSSYGLVDARIGYETERYDIYLYGENLFDEEYVTRAVELSNIWYGRSGSPQIFGIMLTARF